MAKDAHGKKINGGTTSAWPMAGNKVVAGVLEKEEERKGAWNGDKWRDQG